MENWTDKYLLNIYEIDEQHRGFFELWDKECRQFDVLDEKQLCFIIDKLENYLKEHFFKEEELMKKSNFFDLENHLTQHKFFIQKVDEMKLELNYKNALLFEKIAVFMKKWFLSHIMQSDKAYQETLMQYLKKEKT